MIRWRAAVRIQRRWRRRHSLGAAALSAFYARAPEHRIRGTFRARGSVVAKPTSRDLRGKLEHVGRSARHFFGGVHDRVAGHIHTTHSEVKLLRAHKKSFRNSVYPVAPHAKGDARGGADPPADPAIAAELLRRVANEEERQTSLRDDAAAASTGFQEFFLEDWGTILCQGDGEAACQGGGEAAREPAHAKGEAITILSG